MVIRHGWTNYSALLFLKYSMVQVGLDDIMDSGNEIYFRYRVYCRRVTFESLIP